MGAASWVGVSGRATTGKKMAAVVIVTLISLACAVLGEYPAEAERGYGCERGIAALAYNTGTNCSSFEIQNKVNLMQLISLKNHFFSLFGAIMFGGAAIVQPTTLSAAELLSDSLESCTAIVHTVAVPLFYLCGPAQAPNQILANTLSLNSSSHSSL